MQFQFQGFVECLRSGLLYLPNTLLMTFLSVLIGLILGSLIAAARFFRVPVLSQVLAVFVTVYNGVPVVVALMIYNLLFLLKFNDLAAALGLHMTVADVPTVYVGVFTLSLTATCGLSEALRGALLSIDKGQFEAGYSVGLHVGQVMRRIVVPQVVPVALPMLLNTSIGMMKGSSVVIAVGIMDVLNGALLPCQMTYSFLVGYVAAALLYWALAVVIERAASFVQKSADRRTRRPAGQAA